MHQTRQEMSKQLPLPRKGTKYIVRAASHFSSAVPVLIAVRDMLHLAQTAREVKSMIHQKALKLNGRLVTDLHESVKLFNTLEADKFYRLTLLPTGKFTFEEAKEKEIRLCKIIGKALQKGNQVQYNLHDGANLASRDAFAIGDSLYLDKDSKVKKHVALAKGKSCMVIAGKYAGLQGIVESLEGTKVTVKVNGGSTVLEQASVVVQ